MEKKTIVISGINLVDAGALSVYLDFLNSLIENGFASKYRIIALVGRIELFNRFASDIELIEYRKSKESWILRLYYEYFGFRKLSKRIKINTWISMHDTTPNVIAEHRFVYCHNPSPFNNMSIKDAKYGLKYYLFSKFYKYLYRINIRKNDAVIVQQDWMRDEFIKMYHPKKVIVARPSIPQIQEIEDRSEMNKCIFVFPSFPRYYKNFQIACEATKQLNENGIENFQLFITLTGNENSYSKYLFDKYKNVKSIVFCGLLSRNELFDLYSKSTCLIFMSKLETWGMPITEYKSTQKAMIVADLPYARETVGVYSNVAFVECDNPVYLVAAMKKVLQNEHLGSVESVKRPVKPYAENWKQLSDIIFSNV